MSNGVSVIICCYNSASRLPETIKHLARQKVSSSIRWEVIIVDNNSSDNTREVAESEWAKYHLTLSFKIILEPNQGLSFARKKGVLESSYDIVIFCDDDNWLSDKYLENAFNLLESNTKIGIAGGVIQALPESTPPSWFPSYCDWYACGSQSYKDGDISEKSYVWGAGMVIRKEIFYKLDELSIQSVLSDRKGTSLASGGDSEISKWAILLGYNLWYSETLKLEHFIPSERLTVSYLEKMLAGNKEGDYWLDKYNILIEIKRLRLSSRKLFTKGLKLLLISMVSNSTYNRKYAQFMIGDFARISCKDDYHLAREFHSLLHT